MARSLSRRAMLACTLISFSASATSALVGQDTLYYASLDGVRGLNLTNRTQARTIPSSVLGDAGQGVSRQIAFDAGTNLLWYSSVNGILRSVNVLTRVAGPTIAQSAIPGGFSTQPRRMTIDSVRRRLFVSLRTGGVAIFNLGGLLPSLFRTIPSGGFVGINTRELREFAVDVRTGNLWYAASDGTIPELSVVTMRGTGRVIPAAELFRGGQGFFRRFTIDPVRDLLLFASITGGVEAVNLTTLRRDAFALPSNAFGNPGTGAARILTTDIRGLVGSAVPVGSGCQGTVTTPRLSTFLNRVPVVGRSFLIHAVSGATGAPAMMQIGVLTPPRAVFGAPGCTSYVLPLRVVPLTSRLALFSTMIPRDPNLIGRQTSYQMVVPDPQANAAGRVYSNALRTVIGTHAPAITFRIPTRIFP